MVVMMGLFSIAGLVATGVAISALTGWLNVETIYQQVSLRISITYGCITLAFIMLALWLNNSLKDM